MRRRAFFTEGLRNLLKPVADLLEERIDHARRSVEASRRAAEGSAAAYSEGFTPGGYYSEDPDDRLLRPPGAVAEELFLERCSRGGKCVAACPVQAIQFHDGGGSADVDDRVAGTPTIDPQIQACVVCEDLACMQVCPSGALQKIPRHLIDMGIAELRRDICLRSDGEDCQICVEKCPLGAVAIEIPHQGADVEVKTDGCVGCGVCEMYCPTVPRAIVVKERSR